MARVAALVKLFEASSADTTLLSKPSCSAALPVSTEPLAAWDSTSDLSAPSLVDEDCDLWSHDTVSERESFYSACSDASFYSALEEPEDEHLATPEVGSIHVEDVKALGVQSAEEKAKTWTTSCEGESSFDDRKKFFERLADCSRKDVVVGKPVVAAAAKIASAVNLFESLVATAKKPVVVVVEKKTSGLVAGIKENLAKLVASKNVSAPATAVQPNRLPAALDDAEFAKVKKNVAIGFPRTLSSDKPFVCFPAQLAKELSQKLAAIALLRTA
eukprot:tig00000042_g15405.t1